MSDAEQPAEPEKKKRPEWLKPALIFAAFLLVVGGAGFGLGYVTKSDDSGPDLTRDEAFAEAKEKTRKEVKRQMARDGFNDGIKTGRSHGIIAGGMAAESAVTVTIREQKASAAWSSAASAQAELAGMTGAPPAIPTVP